MEVRHVESLESEEDPHRLTDPLSELEEVQVIRT